MRILLVGGSKSGKSSLAQDLAKKLAPGGPLIYWATMEAVDGEDDARIQKHIIDRAGMGFVTIERGRDITAASVPENATVLFDSVTALLANETFAPGFEPEAHKRVARDIIALSLSCRNFVCVADEVFRDGSVYDDTTETYRRGLALILRALAREFDAAAEVVCGLPKVFKGVLPE